MTNEKFNLYINRELSWLKFNERVLEEAESALNPIFERLTFCHIYNANLDEFYMVRVGSLLDQTFLNKTILDSKTNMSSREQIEAINHDVHLLLDRKNKAYFENINGLSTYGVIHADLKAVPADLLTLFEHYFDEHIIHLLSPQIIDKHHPFPFLENKKLYIGATLQYKNGMKLGIVPIEPYIEKVIFIPYQKQLFFIPVEELIYFFVHKIFHNKELISHTIFKVTRNTDIDTNDDLSDQEVDYIEIMQELLKKRRKLAAVRLEFQYHATFELENELCENLQLTSDQVFVQNAPLDLSFIFQLKNHLATHKDLFYKPLKPQPPANISTGEPLYKQILRKDLLLHYPYHSMKYFIQLLNESADDSEVISIRITLYRMARESAIIEALIKAAENGIDVGVVVELRARFDERNNIEWAKKLEEAGCKISYGIEGHKVHSKLLLITRKSGSKIHYLTHVGTGNFNEKTAKLYTDISLFTAHQEIGVEASIIFNCLFTGDFVENTQHLLVAPKCLKSKIIFYIDREIAFAKRGEPSEILLKMNSLTDKLIINKLIEASQAGVKITMIIRGICCLRPGIIGMTDTIKVISIVGRFLEHSRLYVFGPRDRADIFISSADFMTRNTEKRVEVAAPIYQAETRSQIFEWLDSICFDNVKARELQCDGLYTKQSSGSMPLDSQMYLFEQAYLHAAQKPNPSLTRDYGKRLHSRIKSHTPSTTLFTQFIRDLRVKFLS